MAVIHNSLNISIFCEMGWLSIRAFQLIACLYLVGYWAVTDVLEQKLTKLLEGVTALFQVFTAYFNILLDIPINECLSSVMVMLHKILKDKGC